MRRAAALLTTMFAMALIAGPASATVIPVTTTADQGYGAPSESCSLRNAVIAADRDVAVAGCPAGGPSDAVELPAGTYELSLGTAGDSDPASGDIDLSGQGSVTIWPTSKTDVVTIDGGGLDRIFDVKTVAESYLDLRRLNVTGGDAGKDSNGGAIRVSGGDVRLFGTSMFGNRAGGDGGAIFAYRQGMLETKNSTFAHNAADGDGGAIALAGNPYSLGSLTTTTIAGNVADQDRDGKGDGGGVSGVEDGTSIEIENSILARNVDHSPRLGDRAPDCASHTPLGFAPEYLVTTAMPSVECPMSLLAPSPPSNYFRTDPKFISFGFHGGPTRTFSIGYGSPAIGAGAIYSQDHCPAFDQRGVRRPFGLCDAGAFQYSRLGEGVLPGVRKASKTTAVLDGRSVLVRVRCPKKYRPVCHSQATVLDYPSAGSKAMTRPKTLAIPSGRSRLVRFRIVAKFQGRIAAMTQIDRRRLYLRQQIHARQYGESGEPGWNLEIDWYKVRIRK